MGVVLIRNRLTLKEYHFGISTPGILAVALIMLPNLAYFLATPPNDFLNENSAVNDLWNLVENSGRFGLMLALCFVVHGRAPRGNLLVSGLAVASILAYYGLWWGYFMGAVNQWLLLGLAFFPALFFLLVSWQQRNGIALFFASVFAVVHVAATIVKFL